MTFCAGKQKFLSRRVHSFGLFPLGTLSMPSTCPGVSGTYAPHVIHVIHYDVIARNGPFVTVRRERREWEKNQRPSQQPFERTGSGPTRSRYITRRDNSTLNCLRVIIIIIIE